MRRKYRLYKSTKPGRRWIISEECPVCGRGPVTAMLDQFNTSHPGWSLGEDKYTMQCESCQCDFWDKCGLVTYDSFERLETKVAREVAKKLLREL